VRVTESANNHSFIDICIILMKKIENRSPFLENGAYSLHSDSVNNIDSETGN